MQYEFKAKVWLYDGAAAWHFVTLPQNIADEIKDSFGQNRSGWGSIRVVATIQKSSWNTSIFPDKKTDSYLLPIKAEVRKKTGLAEGDTTKVKLEIKPED